MGSLLVCLPALLAGNAAGQKQKDASAGVLLTHWFNLVQPYSRRRTLAAGGLFRLPSPAAGGYCYDSRHYRAEASPGKTPAH